MSGLFLLFLLNYCGGAPFSKSSRSILRISGVSSEPWELTPWPLSFSDKGCLFLGRQVRGSEGEDSREDGSA